MMKLYFAAVPVVVLILIGAVATVLISRKPVPDDFRYDFERVYRLYDGKKYLEAVAGYRSLLDKYQVESADLYFNLANAHFKAEQIGPAVYYYKKALKLRPNDQQIRFNLSFALDQYGLGRNEQKGWFKQKLAVFMSLVSLPKAAKLTVILYWIFVLALSVALFVRRKTIVYGATVLGIIFFLAAGYSLASYSISSRHREGVVLAERADIKYSYDAGDDVAFTLGGGTIVDILNRKNGWYQIWLPDGRAGWISSTQFGEV